MRDLYDKPKLKNIPLVIKILESGMTNREIAKKAGLNFCNLSNIVNLHHRPRPATARALAKALNTTPEKIGFVQGGAK